MPFFFYFPSFLFFAEVTGILRTLWKRIQKLLQQHPSVQKDSASVQAHSRDSASDITSEKQYLRTTWYFPDGRIRKVQEAGRATERASMAVHDSGSSAVSVAEQKVDSTKKVNLKKLETEQLKAFTDSRSIQGAEWIPVIAVIIGAICLMVVYYLPKKKKE